MSEQAEFYEVSDIHQIKALADPLRQQILGAFVREPRTTKQVATLLGQPPTRLYRHVDLLERVGLIRLIETRPKRGTIEKYFQAIASRFAVAGHIAGEAGSLVEETFAKAFASVQKDIRRAVESGQIDAASGSGETVMALGTLRISSEDLPELQNRIAHLADGLHKEGERKWYRLLVTVVPVSETTDEHAS